jgi:outer membrane protein insertion porin family
MPLLSKITIIALALALLSGAGPRPVQGADGDKDMLYFLPLKINAPDRQEALRRESDQLLEKAAAAGKVTMISREQAVNALDYRQGVWPPGLSELRRLLPADATGYLAAGSLTSLGARLSLDLTLYQLDDPAAGQSFIQEIDREEELAAGFSALLEQIDTFVNRRDYIAAIKIAGNSRIDTGAIRQRLGSRPGDRYSPTALRKDLKEIFAMGYFHDIRIDSEVTPKGREVTFTVSEKQVVGKIKITGTDKKSEEDVRAAIKIKSHSIINDSEIRASIINIRNLYREDGYYDCQVTVERQEGARGRVDLTFAINEGPQVYIKKITFSGNHSFKAGKLEDVITTSEKSLFSFITDAGLLDKKKLEDDASRIAAFYHNNGFVDAKIGDPEVTQQGKWFYVNFTIDEGERYRCGTIELVGDLIADPEVLRKKIEIDREEYFSRKVLRADILRLTDFYADQGYAFAEIDPRLDKDAERRVVNLTLQINQGQLVHINRINIKGNTRTRDKVIRREILLDEGGIFGATKLKDSHQELQRLDFFEDVNISPEPTLDENLLDLNVEVKEKPTGKFSIGAGYSSLDHMTFMGEISEGNLFGRGQRLALQANVSSRTNQFNLDFTEPHIFDSKLLLGFNVYRWKREYDDYTKNSEGGAVRAGFPIWEKLRFNFSYGYDDTTLDDVELLTASRIIIDSMDFHITSAVKVGLSRDTRDRLYAATKGSQNTFTIKYAGGPLGGDNSFTKVEASSGWYLPIPLQMLKSTTFHTQLSAGQIFGNSQGHLPVFEKFYLGGISTIRGFDSGRISPLDPVTGDRIGGDKMFYLNLEYIFPLVKEQGLLGVIFHDIGNVYGVDEVWHISRVKRSVGAGVRWLSPLGPLRLEWGYNLYPKGDEDTSKWEFSIGGSF